jgi:hypothetical protein
VNGQLRVRAVRQVNGSAMCAAARELTISAPELMYAGHSVLAIPSTDRNDSRVVVVIKGDTRLDSTISGPVFRADAAAMQSQKPLLLVRDEAWPVWVNFGPVSAEQAEQKYVVLFEYG